MANQLLGQFKEHPQSWTRVDTILEHSTHPNTKYFALSILDSLVLYRWNLLPQEQKVAIRNYLIDLIIKLSGTDESRTQNHVILAKMNAVLVQVRSPVLYIVFNAVNHNPTHHPDPKARVASSLANIRSRDYSRKQNK